MGHCCPQFRWSNFIFELAWRNFPVSACLNCTLAPRSQKSFLPEHKISQLSPRSPMEDFRSYEMVWRSWERVRSYEFHKAAVAVERRMMCWQYQSLKSYTERCGMAWCDKLYFRRRLKYSIIVMSSWLNQQTMNNKNHHEYNVSEWSWKSAWEYVCVVCVQTNAAWSRCIFLPLPSSPKPLTSWLFEMGDLKWCECKFFPVATCCSRTESPHLTAVPTSHTLSPCASFTVHRLCWSSLAPWAVTECCPLPLP